MIPIYILHIALIASVAVGQNLRISLGATGGSSVIFSDLIVALLYLTFTIYLLFSKKVKPDLKNISHIGNAFLLFISITAISYLAGIPNMIELGESTPKNLIVALMYLGRLWAYMALPFVFTVIYNNTKKSLQKITKISIVSTTLYLCAAGFHQLQTHSDFTDMAIKSGWDPHQGRLLSTWFDPNFFGAFLGLIACVFFAKLIEQIKSKEEIKYIFLNLSILVVVMVTQLLTFSRTGYLSTIAGITIIGVVRARKLLVATAIILIIATSLNPRAIERIQGAKNVDATASKRIVSWTKAATIMADFPVLGVGYNHLGPYQAQKSYVDEYDVNNRYGFENTFLTIGATTGFLGLISYLLYLGLILVYLARHSKNNIQTLGVFASQIALMISAIFINSLAYPHILIINASILAIVFTKKINKNTN